MATPIIKGETVVGITEEVTEGVFVEASSASDYVQPLEDGLELNFAKDLKERSVLNNSIGKSRARVGIKSAVGAVPVELAGPGVEGAAPDHDLLLKALLGSRVQLLARVTTKAAGNTDQVLQIEDADIASFQVDNVILVLEGGDHFLTPITAVDTTGGAANITLLRTRSAGAFSASVEISKFTNYFPANSGHITLSQTVYWGNTIRASASGMRPLSMTLSSFSTGELSALEFGLEGINFNEIDGAAPVTPVFANSAPPLILSACVFQDGVDTEVNEVGLNVENSVAFKTATCSADGRQGSRITSRDITFNFNPYKDDTDVSQFDRFNDNTPFSLFWYAANPSAVAGEFELGSISAFWLPQAIINEKPVGDLEGLLTEDIAAIADRGVDGSLNDIIIASI